MDTQLKTFVGGEVTPRILGRNDIERFQMSALLLENFFIRPQGPLVRRRGSETLASSIPSPGKLASFAPRRETSDVLLFSDAKITVLTQTI